MTARKNQVPPIAIIRGNGMTDDTEALRAYFAGDDVLHADSGKRINLYSGDEIPRGTYRITVRMPPEEA